MNKYIQEAIEKLPDYSEKFTMKVDKVRLDLTTALNMNFTHDKDMNYSVAQKLSHCTRDSNGMEYKLVIYISSRAPVFTILCLIRMSKNEWSTPVIIDQQSESIRRMTENVSMALQNIGFRSIQGPVLYEYVSGVVTDMDGAPATVFDALFSELH